MDVISRQSSLVDIGQTPRKSSWLCGNQRDFPVRRIDQFARPTDIRCDEWSAERKCLANCTWTVLY